jgi:predicted MFS family arabinose efflux permease
MLAKLSSGALADRLDRHQVFLACLVIMLGGTILLATMRESLLMTAVVAIVVGWGSLCTLYNKLAISNFGLCQIGRITCFIICLESVGIGIGSWVTGALYDHLGSYDLAFALNSGLLALSLLAGPQTGLRPCTLAAELDVRRF